MDRIHRTLEGVSAKVGFRVVSELDGLATAAMLDQKKIAAPFDHANPQALPFEVDFFLFGELDDPPR
jgi:hypothetical protein